MPRRPRVHYVGAVYHVMMQGNYRQDIFYSDSDFRRFYFFIERAVRQYNCKIHLFCLMTNHIHLMVEVSSIPLMKIMQSITSAYSNYINRKMDRNGHLFRGRYLDKIVEDERYMKELCYYIHMNPVKAGLVDNLDDYPWSSHLAYTKVDHLGWLTQSNILNLIKSPFLLDSENAYLVFMRSYHVEYAEAKFCQVNESGALTIERQANKNVRSIDGLDLSVLSLNEISSLICEHEGIAVRFLGSGVKKDIVTLTRTLVAYYSHYHAKHTLSQVAKYMGCHVDTLSKTMNRQFASEKKRCIINLKIDYFNREFVNLLAQRKQKVVEVTATGIKIAAHDTAKWES